MLSTTDCEVRLTFVGMRKMCKIIVIVIIIKIVLKNCCYSEKNREMNLQPTRKKNEVNKRSIFTKKKNTSLPKTIIYKTRINILQYKLITTKAYLIIRRIRDIWKGLTKSQKPFSLTAKLH